MTPEFQRQLGIAAIVFATLIGLGSCTLLAGIGQNYAGGVPLLKMEFAK